MRHVPDFRSAEFLREQVLQAMAFYDERAVDPSGGLYHFFRDDGSVYDIHDPDNWAFVFEQSTLIPFDYSGVSRPPGADRFMVEYGHTSDIFTNPREERTKDYITGRYG